MFFKLSQSPGGSSGNNRKPRTPGEKMKRPWRIYQGFWAYLRGALAIPQMVRMVLRRLLTPLHWKTMVNHHIPLGTSCLVSNAIDRKSSVRNLSHVVDASDGDWGKCGNDFVPRCDLCPLWLLFVILWKWLCSVIMLAYSLNGLRLGSKHSLSFFHPIFPCKCVKLCPPGNTEEEEAYWYLPYDTLVSGFGPFWICLHHAYPYGCFCESLFRVA